MTGNGELVAQELVTPLREAGYAPSIMMMDAADAGDLVGGGLYLIVSSTYGNGDVPDNAQSFFASLQASRPRLSDVVYGLIALGDTTYKATFCEGGMKFDRLLTELGARRAGAPLLHDANSGSLPEDAALDWIADWIEQELAPAIAA
jgi:MioC protein